MSASIRPSTRGGVARNHIQLAAQRSARERGRDIVQRELRFPSVPTLAVSVAGQRIRRLSGRGRNQRRSALVTETFNAPLVPLCAPTRNVPPSDAASSSLASLSFDPDRAVERAAGEEAELLRALSAAISAIEPDQPNSVALSSLARRPSSLTSCMAKLAGSPLASPPLTRMRPADCRRGRASRWRLDPARPHRAWRAACSHPAFDHAAGLIGLLRERISRASADKPERSRASRSSVDAAARREPR